MYCHCPNLPYYVNGPKEKQNKEQSQPDKPYIENLQKQTLHEIWKQNAELQSKNL